MSQVQEESCQVNVEPSISDDEEMDFHRLAQTELESCHTDFQSILRHTAVVCAENDDCDMVQAKHVKLARLAVYRMRPPDNGIGMFSLLGGFCFAVALAIPDTTSLWFGDPGKGFFWGFLKVLVGLLIGAGFFFSARAFYIALGPHRPQWLTKACEVIGNLRESKD